MMEAALSIEHLTKRYQNGTVAVDDISLSIPKGEFFGFLGPNGAGKTTVINCTTGIAKISSGTINIFGTDVVLDYRDARKKVGLSPQEFNVDFFGKIGKLLDYVGGYYGLPKARRKERIDELFERFGLKDYADKTFRELSGGYKRRVMLARALIHDPDLIIFDEPTAGVDVELRHDLWRYMRELNEQGKTIILTSHYLEEVELLCNQIAIINNGKIVLKEAKSTLVKDGKRLEDVYLKITKGEPW
ncbi:MAG TPA: ABC transporter ATP-binding protein [Candidatus Paceibacterota bacterium]|jgi:ABC-2 type transport system ATP-binding protein